MILRGESRRIAQLSNIIAVKLSNEDFIPCQALILIIRNSKLNRYHKIKYIKIIRNREILFYSLLNLTFYFFWRWGFRKPNANKIENQF